MYVRLRPVVSRKVSSKVIPTGLGLNKGIFFFGLNVSQSRNSCFVLLVEIRVVFLQIQRKSIVRRLASVVSRQC